MFDRATATTIPRPARLATVPESLTGNLAPSDVRLRRLAAERALDEVLAESFPASDPPSWTPGTVRPAPARAIAVASPSRSDATFTDALLSFAAATGVVLFVPVAILLVGAPIALVIRGLLEGFRWLLG